MRVCVVGSGGREHALAETFHRQGCEVVVLPGNAGIEYSMDQNPLDAAADLFVVGPEAPLVDGLADQLRDQGKLVFGPGRDGAKLEGSKAWMKNMLRAARVPTARYHIVDSRTQAVDVLKREFNWRAAIKTDGLAAGKGVTIVTGPQDASIARADVRAKFEGSFGDAGKILVIEELLDGEEVSLFAICNGRDYMLFDGARDYKRLLDGDLGPNTGGMGSYSPSGTEPHHQAWAEICIRPLLDKLVDRGIDYRGVLYAGLMITEAGPKVLEFNIRFGDPEIQSIAPRLTSDLAALLVQAASGKPMDEPTFSADFAVTVVRSSYGYPGKPSLGDAIPHLEPALHSVEGDTYLNYAAVQAGQRRLITNGGRVMSVTSLASTREGARWLVYQTVDLLRWPGAHSRRDIAAE